MSLLDNFPHKCRIVKRVRTKRTLGGSRDSETIVSSNVDCWEQHATSTEILDYEKRGMSINRKIYFLTDPGVTVQHSIYITERLGTTVSSPIKLEVRTEALPDASAGLGIVYRVMAEEVTSDSN